MIDVLAVLILFMVIGAIIAVETSRLLFSVISVGAVGFLLAIAFLFLGAPDVAIVQIGVEVVSLVILVRATIGREAETPARRQFFVGSIVAVTFVAGIALLGLETLAEFPAFGSSVMQRVADAPATTYLKEGLAQTGAPNAVTAVLLDYRAYDTLGEATVLFCAVLGAVTILRRKTRTTVGAAENKQEVDPQ
jgi:multisubunit Na+/H+ antiporter MnhB subunit